MSEQPAAPEPLPDERYGQHEGFTVVDDNFDAPRPVDNHYYEVLEIERTATLDGLKKKYRQLSLKYHPDRHPGHEDHFKEISEAYSILSDPTLREIYDSFGRAGLTAKRTYDDHGAELASVSFVRYEFSIILLQRLWIIFVIGWLSVLFLDWLFNYPLEILLFVVVSIGLVYYSLKDLSNILTILMSLAIPIGIASVWGIFVSQRIVIALNSTLLTVTALLMVNLSFIYFDLSVGIIAVHLFIEWTYRDFGDFSLLSRLLAAFLTMAEVSIIATQISHFAQNFVMFRYKSFLYPLFNQGYQYIVSDQGESSNQVKKVMITLGPMLFADLLLGIRVEWLMTSITVMALPLAQWLQGRKMKLQVPSVAFGLGFVLYYFLPSEYIGPFAHAAFVFQTLKSVGIPSLHVAPVIAGLTVYLLDEYYFQVGYAWAATGAFTLSHFVALSIFENPSDIDD